MLVPERTITWQKRPFNTNRHFSNQDSPFKKKNSSYVLCKSDKDDKAWYLAEVYKIYPEEIEVMYYTTPRQQLDDYETADHEQRQERLSQCRFWKTWLVHAIRHECRQGRHQCTFPQNNPLLRLWKMKPVMNKFENLIRASDSSKLNQA
jgi:hypothetical protein